MSISALNIGVSSLKAYDSAIGSSAHNIANANTNGFKPQIVQFQEGKNGGVIVNISQAGRDLAVQDNNSSTQASETDLATEITNTLQYKIKFELAAKLIKTSDAMLETLADLQK